MRTTLNLDDDVAARLAAEARKRGDSLSRTANEYLRAGLRAAQEVDRAGAYEPPTFDSGRPRLDASDVAAALESLDRAAGAPRDPCGGEPAAAGASQRLRPAR